MPDSTPVRMFGTPQDDKPAIPWVEVERRLRDAIVYWITASDGAARPVWAVWLDDALWFSTGSSRLWRGFGASPTASAHLEDGHDVVVIEGTQRGTDGEDLQPFCDAYNAKYAWDFEPGKLPGPAVILTPRAVLAWKTGSWRDARTDPFPLASARFTFG